MDEVNTVNQNSIQANIFTEQIRILYKNVLVNVLASFICSTVVFIGLYTSTNYLLLYWFVSVIFISIFRLSTAYYYHSSMKSNEFYLFIYIFGMSISALLWGAAGSILMPQSDLLEQMIVIVIIAGVTAGGIQTLNANLIACLIYVTSIVLPLCIWLFMQPGTTYFLLSVAMATYLLFMLATSVRGYKLLLSVLTLRYENSALVDNLSTSNLHLFKSYTLLEQREKEIVLINKMNSILQACNKLSEAYEPIRLTAEELFLGFNGGLSILNTKTNDFEVIIQWGDKHLLKPLFNVADCWSLRKEREYFINNTSNGIVCNHFISRPISYICLPLNTKSSQMALLVLATSREDSFTSHHLQLAISFGEVIQLALMNIKLRESLLDASIHDPLTKLFNRRYLDEMLSREMRLIIRDKKSLCVAMLDLDYFKIFNDQNGHEAGDIILKEIGNILNENFRESDIACRYGGEEFLVVLVNTDLSSAYLKLDHIREIIKERKIYYKDKLLKAITISIGIAEAPMQGTTVEDIISAADEALYSAKKSGRDRTVVYEFDRHKILK